MAVNTVEQLVNRRRDIGKELRNKKEALEHSTGKTATCNSVLLSTDYGKEDRCSLCVHEHENWGNNKHCKLCINRYLL